LFLINKFLKEFGT